MSLAFTQVFDRLQDNSLAIYTDTQHNRIHILNPQAQSLSKLPFQSVLDIPNYLYLNGFEAQQWVDRDSQAHDAILARRSLTQWLLSALEKQRGTLKWLNAICQQTGFSQYGAPFQGRVTLHQPPFGEARAVLQRSQDANLLRFTEEEICFLDRESAQYLGGGWLEEWAYCAAIDADIECVALNVTGQWADQNHATPISNELDLVLVHNNHFLILECKTLDWLQHNQGQNVTLKLESLLRHLGGTLSRGILVSVCELGAQNHQRIRHLPNLSAQMGNALYGLPNQLRLWRDQVALKGM